MSPAADGSDALVAQARALQEEGRWDETALEVNRRVLAQFPDDQAAAVRAARCLRALGRLDEAAEVLVKLVAAHPGNGVARSQLDRTMSRRRARSRAEEHIARSPAALFAELEEAKRAERDHDFQVEGRRLLARRDRTVQAACALGAAQRAAKDLDGARNSYRWAFEQDDDPRTNAMAHIGLAGVLRDQQQLDGAERLLRGVLRVEPSNRYARLGLAALLMDRVEHRGRRDLLPDARQLLSALWAATPGDPLVSAAYGRLKSLGG